MILRFTLLLLIACSFHLYGQNEDCPLAFDLVDRETPLRTLTDLRIEPFQLTNAGIDDGVTALKCQQPLDFDIDDAIRMDIINFPPSVTRVDSMELEELFAQLRVTTTNDTLPYRFAEGKSFWFSFNVTEAGSFEMMITPDEVDGAIGGNFDFLIIKGDCPSNPCAETVFCGSWGPPACYDEIVALTAGVFEASKYSATGLANNPILDYGVIPEPNLPEIWEAIELEQGANYYVLIDHTEPDLLGLAPALGFSACEYQELGCTIEFGGSATITSTKPSPVLEAILPPSTADIVNVCADGSNQFSADVRNFIGVQPADFIWTFPSDASIQGSGKNIEVFFGRASGEVCVEMGCPVQDKICWTVEIGQDPNLQLLNPTPEPCNALMLADYVEDLNNVAGRLALFGSQQDALLQDNELPATDINVKGTYWIQKITPSFCTDSPIRITSEPIVPNLEVAAQQGACELPYDLNNLTIQELNGFSTSTNFIISFYNSEADANNDENPITEAMDYGTYWIRGEETMQDCYDVAAVELVNATPNFQSIFPRVACDSFELSGIVPLTIENIPAPFVTFFESESEAMLGTSPIQESFITESSEVWAKAGVEIGCPGFIPVNIVINKTVLNPIEQVPYCGDAYALSNLPLNGADDYSFFSTKEEADNQTNPFLDGEVTSSTTIWVRGEDTTTGCSDIIEVSIVATDPMILPIPTINGCGTPYNLNEVTVLEAGAIDLTKTYHRNLADAEAGRNPISGGLITTSDTYYVRGTIAGPEACFDVAPITVNLIIPDIQQPGPQRLDEGQFDLQNARILDLTTLERLTNLTYFADSLEASNDRSPIASIVSAVGIYWIKGELNGCPVIVPQEILAESMATIPLPDLPAFPLPCTGNCLNLAAIISGEELTITSPNLVFNFFETEEEAEDGFLVDTLQSLEFCNPTTLWVRGTDTNGEFGLTRVEIGEREVISGTLLNEDLAICEENSDQLSLDLQLDGQTPFEVIYTDGSRDFTVSATTNNFQIPIDPASTSTYTLVNITDAKGCPGMTGGAVTFTLLEQVAIDNFEKICNDIQTEYSISFDITKGDIESVMYDGIRGTQQGNRFFSDPIPVNDNYTFTITDMNSCGPLPPLTGNHICVCTTEAPVLDRTPINACIDEAVVATEAEIGFLTMTDKKYYVIHDSNIDQLGAIFSFQDSPDMRFSEDLEVGTTYYLSVVVTKEDPQGAPIFDTALNPCLSVSRGIPVRFFDMPEVSINLGNNTACAGDLVEIAFEMNAEGPFNAILFDGETTKELDNIQNGHIERVSASTSRDFIVEYIEFSELESCINEAPDDATASLEVSPTLTYENLELVCEPTGATFVITFDIVGGDPTTYRVDDENALITDGTFTSSPILHQSNYRFEIRDGNGCEPVIIQDFGACLCTAEITTTISQIQDISCPGATDGAVQVMVENGLPPYSFRWQNGSTATQLMDLAEGMISVTMTDENGCERMDSLFLDAPDAIAPEIEMNAPSCYGDENGNIIIKRVNGGTKPYDFYFNSGIPSSAQLYGNLASGDYPFQIIDSKGCEYEDTLSLLDPDPLTVSLLNNPKRLNWGDSIEIDTRVSESDVEFTWSANMPLSCMDCLNPTTTPTETGIYSITVTNESGCTASDELVVQVLNERTVYAPTAFSPNGDGINDTFSVFGTNQVISINYLRVFDRWGALLYERSGLGQRIPIEEGWNGLSKNGDTAPSGVYVFVVEIVFSDGEVEVITGDVALLR